MKKTWRKKKFCIAKQIEHFFSEKWKWTFQVICLASNIRRFFIRYIISSPTFGVYNVGVFLINYLKITLAQTKECSFTFRKPCKPLRLGIIRKFIPLEVHVDAELMRYAIQPYLQCKSRNIQEYNNYCPILKLDLHHHENLWFQENYYPIDSGAWACMTVNNFWFTS